VSVVVKPFGPALALNIWVESLWQLCNSVTCRTLVSELQKARVLVAITKGSNRWQIVHRWCSRCKLLRTCIWIPLDSFRRIVCACAAKTCSKGSITSSRRTAPSLCLVTKCKSKRRGRRLKLKEGWLNLIVQSKLKCRQRLNQLKISNSRLSVKWPLAESLTWQRNPPKKKLVRERKRLNLLLLLNPWRLLIIWWWKHEARSMTPSRCCSAETANFEESKTWHTLMKNRLPRPLSQQYLLKMPKTLTRLQRSQLRRRVKNPNPETLIKSKLVHSGYAQRSAYPKIGFSSTKKHLLSSNAT